MINWNFARMLSKIGTESEAVSPNKFDFHSFSLDAMHSVVAYTKLDLTEIPQAENVSQQEWASINLESMEFLAGPLMAKVKQEDTFKKVLGELGGGFAGGNVGLFVGFLSKNVLGQFDISMFQPERKPRLLYIGSNLERAAMKMEADPESFYRWVALHEVTHVAQFSSCSWLATKLSTEVKAVLKQVENKDKAQKNQHMDTIQAIMSVVEGYSEHVMDEVGQDVLPVYANMRDKMEARRDQRSEAVKLVFKLVGFDKKMEQYQKGKVFCDYVAKAEGIDKLNLVWRSPEDMPTLEEIDNPAAWLKRVQ